MTAPDPSDSQRVLDQAYQWAYRYEQTFGCCRQCVLAAIQDVLGIGCDDLFKAAHGLAGGGALTRAGTCGALPAVIPTNDRGRNTSPLPSAVGSSQ